MSEYRYVQFLQRPEEGRAVDLLELLAVVSCQMWVLGIEGQSLQ